MKCPQCRFENPEGARFCGKCRAKLLVVCPQCGFKNPPENDFCNECGYKLEEEVEAKKPEPAPEGERRYITVLFSDLSGYTAMSERLDPEELKEITGRIFGEIAKVVSKYDGFIEKFVGDAVMALFGVPKAHEDDPIRAVRAASEIHDVVEALSPQLEKRIGRPLSMHTGINTGLVVTGQVDLEMGTHGVAGDTINLASRLSGLARAGQIVVGPETHRQAEGYFAFESLGPTTVKGKAEPVRIFEVISPREEPSTIHRLHGLRADLVGRKVEMAQLVGAAERLRDGKGTIVSICGDAGTGKSRLVEEFRATLDLEQVQWVEGHAYAYSQNIPYFPLIDLLNRAWQIEEGDPPETVRAKVESAIEHLIGRREDIVPYVGSLYSLSYPEIEGVSPEFWKARLQEAIQAIFAALAQRAPTVVCLEDIHWADPSSLDLLRSILSESMYPALFLLVYRLPFSLFTSHELSGTGKHHEEIRLQDLSPSETQDMMESLLRTKNIPPDLSRFVQQKIEGNPFYLEEVINALIESGTLVREDAGWRLTRPIGELDLSPTLQGVISARLDRLGTETKRILQEASVIGRAFLYEILRRITELREHIDRCLSGLERLDLIRARSLEPDIEYVFKHTLIQEVVYNGLLKKERREIHERIGLVMEEFFRERLSEFYEALAFHFAQGRSANKAVDYLVKSGEKSLRRYAVEESDQYFKEAFDLLAKKPGKTKEEEGLLIDLLIKWAYVFYYRGDFRGLVDLLSAHERVPGSLDDKAKLGMFYGWLGMGLHCRDRYKDAHQYLCRALELGEEIQNGELTGYACAWLTWTCTELGRLDEAIAFGQRAQEIAADLRSDHYLYFKSLGGMGYAYWAKGERKKAFEAGKALVEFGRKQANIRSQVMGHYIIGFSHLANGDFPSAIESFERGVHVSADPFYTQMPRMLVGFSYALNGQFEEAQEPLQEAIRYSETFGCEVLGTAAKAAFGAVLIAKGRMSQGSEMLEESIRQCVENGRRSLQALFEYILGKIYLNIVERRGPISLSVMAKNVGFLTRNLPFSGKRAEEHLNRSIEIAKEIGAEGILGPAYLDLGLLHKTKGRTDKARESISEAIRIFKECESEVYLRRAKECLTGLA